MTDLPLVSIVTPSFNQAKFLEQTIQSVLNQDYPNIEYLVVDGGSTDGSVEIIQRYSGRLAWWVSEEDHGQADGINKGLARARGKYVAWLNSDDYYLPGAVLQAVALLEQHPELAFVHGDLQVVDESGKVINVLTYGNWGVRGLMAFKIIGQPAVFMRHSALEQAGLLDLSYHFLLDHQLWLRLSLQGNTLYHPTLWAGEHVHAASKNTAQAAQFGQEAYRIVEWMKNVPAFAPQLAGNLRKVQAGAERLNAFYLLEAGQYQASFRSYWRAFWLHPNAVLSDWYRMLYALFAPLGLEIWKESYLRKRRERFSSKNNTEGDL